MKNLMDVQLIQGSLSRFYGEHDFRNFSKVDLTNCVNYKRIVYQIKMERIKVLEMEDNDD
jgi:tRNA U38,U39,U40 pseudouridine synthase TruA